MKTNKSKTDFWSHEHCEYCDGSILGKKVEVCRKAGNKYFVVKNVPAGVCRSCGARYFSANSLKLFARIVKGRLKSRKELEVPVFSL